MLVLFMTSHHLLLMYNFYLFMWWVVNVSFGAVVTVSIMCTLLHSCLSSHWCTFFPPIRWIIGVFPLIQSLPTVQYMSMTSALYLIPVLDKNVREPRVRPWTKKLSNMAITFYLYVRWRSMIAQRKAHIKVPKNNTLWSTSTERIFLFFFIK
jgi:hypothetical protein